MLQPWQNAQSSCLQHASSWMQPAFCFTTFPISRSSEALNSPESAMQTIQLEGKSVSKLCSSFRLPLLQVGDILHWPCLLSLISPIQACLWSTGRFLPRDKEEKISKQIEHVQQIMRLPWIPGWNSCKELC